MNNQGEANLVLNSVLEAGDRAIKDYFEMTGDAGARDIPELWLQSEIARALAADQKYYVFLERRMTDILHDANSGRTLAKIWHGDRLTGRVDIALYERTPKPEDGALKAVIELKKMNSDYCQQDDALRIMSISGIWENGIIGVVAGLFSCNSESQALSLFEETQKRLAEVVPPSGFPVSLRHSPIEKDTRGIFYSGITAARVC